MIKTALTTLALVVTLTGCASLHNVDAQVSSYSRWPAARPPATYSFERLPSQQVHPQEQQMLEDAARRAIEGAGFVTAGEAAPDVTVQLGARITETDRSPFDDPFWYGPWGSFHRPFIYGRFGRPFWGPSWRYYPSAGADWPYYEREVALLIRDKRTGEPLYEGRATSEGSLPAIGTALPAMFSAAIRDFPAGSTSNPHRVVIEAAK